MNRETVASSPPSSQSAASSHRTSATPPAESPEATLAFAGAGGSPSRVIEQLDKLATSLETIASPARGGPAKATEADEECLESYLQRYMQQLTGKTAEKPAAESVIPKKASVQPAAEAASFIQRQPAPAAEDRLRITAMREVANDSARQAMAESTQIQTVVKTRTTYLAAKAISLASCTLAVAYFPTRSGAVLAAAAVLFGIACLLGLRFAGLCRKLGRMSMAAS